MTFKTHASESGLCLALCGLANRFSDGFLWSGSSLAHINGGGVQRILDMRGVVILDHLDAGAAVFGDLVDVRPLHQAEADVGVAEAVSRPRLPLPVGLEVELVQQGVHQLALDRPEDQVGRTRIVAFAEPLEWVNGSRHALAIADAALAAHLDLQDAFPGVVVDDDGDVSRSLTTP